MPMPTGDHKQVDYFGPSCITTSTLMSRGERRWMELLPMWLGGTGASSTNALVKIQKTETTRCINYSHLRRYPRQTRKLKRPVLFIADSTSVNALSRLYTRTHRLSTTEEMPHSSIRIRMVKGILSKVITLVCITLQVPSTGWAFGRPLITA